MDNRKLGDPGTQQFQLDKYPFYLLNRAVSRYNAIIEARLRNIGIDIPTWRVLMILGERAPRSIGEIAVKAVINLSTMMRIVQRMTRRRFVRQAVSSEDGRVREVFLTELGRQKLAAARIATSPVYTAVIEGFSATEFDSLIDMLGRVAVNLETLTG